MVKELQKANEEILFMTFSFTSDAIGDVLVEKKNDGVHVQGVFDRQQKNKFWEYPKLEAAGIPVALDGNRAFMHHKVFIIDRKVVTTGSMNPTSNGNEKNNENLIIIHDESIAKQYLQEFFKVWGET
jgi:phosphatidylserine/phosphatidylglycerophosphate/cardiolipin synthase-like enzyme